MQLIVTRPQADAQRLQTRLEANGHTVCLAPLLSIQVDTAAAIPDRPWQAIAITSANALSAFSDIGIPEQTKAIPVFAVGPASAGLARELGFADVHQADGDLSALAGLIQQALKPAAGPILYLTGQVRSGDLAADLHSGGFEVERVELYDAVAATQLPSRAENLIRSGKADGVLLYSVRTADVWARLTGQAGLRAQAANLTHFCLSQTVADKVRSDLGHHMSIVISSSPNDDAMLETVEMTSAHQAVHHPTPGKGATMANRKQPSRKAKKPTRPTVIDAEATEIKDSDPAKPAAAPTEKSGSAASQAGARKTPEPSAPANADNNSSGDAGKTASTDTSKTKPSQTRSADSSAAAKKPSGKGKLLTGAFVVALLAGVAGGGYLYREHGEKLFGRTAPAIDVGAIEGQALEAIGTAQSASESAATALASTQSLAEKLNQLEQQLTETSSAAATPDPKMQAAISAATEQAKSAQADIAALSAKTGEIETGMTEVRQSLDSLKTALQAAADSGGGAGQADVNLKFDELARRIAKLETAPAPAQPQDDTLANEVAGLRDQLAAATTKMQELESKLEAALAAPKPEVPASAAPQPAAIDTARIAAQLGALSDTVDQGKPYQAELSALQDTAKLTLNLPALTANATTGIATTAQLKQELAGLQAKLDAGSASGTTAAPTSSGWWSTVTGKLSSVIKVRKTTGAVDWSEHVAAARAAIDTGGLGAAIAALDAGGASAPQPVADWIIAARKRQGADEELQKLPQIILGHLPAPVQ